MSLAAGWNCIWPRKLGLAAVTCTLLAGSALLDAGDAQTPHIGIVAAKILNFRLSDTSTRFGALEFIGGLQLQSDAKGFGGFSGLRLHPDRNHLLAVTDKCLVLDGVLERDITGALHDLTGARLRPLPPGSSGKALSKNGHGDCEAVDIAADKAFIAFEYNSQTGRFDIAADGSLANFAQVSPQPGIGRLVRNRGIEAMALFPAGAALAGNILSVSEESLNANGNHRAFITGSAGVAEFAIVRKDDYAVTDADFLPNGDLLVLERRFGLQVAPGMRIRRIPSMLLAGGAMADGPVLLEAGITYRIDNMEGLDVSVNEAGEIFITLISDDNFNYFQSTLLLEFKLAE